MSYYKIAPKYSLGDKVFLVADKEQDLLIVIEHIYTVDGGMLYRVSDGASNTSVYEVELSDEIDQLKSLGIK